MKPQILENCGKKSSFVKSFSPSKTGWKTPQNNTLLGPRRLWVNPKILRSKRVKNATERRIPTIKIKTSIIKNKIRELQLVLQTDVLRTLTLTSECLVSKTSALYLPKK